jgi:UDP-glucose 4-epimerase
MKNTKKIITIIVGKRSNLSLNLHKRINDSVVVSSSELIDSLEQLMKFRKNRINVIFNNFQPSKNLNSFIDPDRYIELSISLTVKVLMFLIHNRLEINQVIYTSSCSVYGNSTKREGYLGLEPIGIPSSLKYLNENFLREICHNHKINLKVARIFNMFGGIDNFSVISRIINCYKNKIPLNVNNHGKSLRDYIHINDVVNIYQKIIDDPSIKFETIDIGSGNSKSLFTILNHLSFHGYNIDTKNSQSNEVNFSQADVSNAKKVVDVSTFIDVKDFLLDELKNVDGKNNN